MGAATVAAFAANSSNSAGIAGGVAIAMLLDAGLGLAAGQRLADRLASPPWIFSIVMSGGLLFLGLYLVGLATVGDPAAVLAGLAPVFLLGLLGPPVKKLRGPRIVYALTAGVFLGIPLAALTLLPRIGVGGTLLAVSLGLTALGLVPLWVVERAD